MNLPNFDHAAWAAFCQHAETEQINQRSAAWLLYDAPPRVDVACPDCGYTRAQDEPWCRVCVASKAAVYVVADEYVDGTAWILWADHCGYHYMTNGSDHNRIDVFTEADINTMIEQDDCDVIDRHDLPCNVRRVDLTNGESICYLPQEYER